MRNSRRAGKPAGRKPEKQGLTGLFTKGKNIPTTAQQTLPYREMYRDGVCRVADRYYTKTIEYEDINYQLAQSEDQAAIFDGWSACLNYFDSILAVPAFLPQPPEPPGQPVQREHPHAG